MKIMYWVTTSALAVTLVIIVSKIIPNLKYLTWYHQMQVLAIIGVLLLAAILVAMVRKK